MAAELSDSMALDTGGSSGFAGRRFDFDFLPGASLVESSAFQLSEIT